MSRYGLLAVYIGGPVAQVDWFATKVGGRLVGKWLFF